MRCLMCNANFSDDVLISHYIYYHSINDNNYFTREFFSPYNVSKRCNDCKLEFQNCRLKKITIFFFIIIKGEAAGTDNYKINILRRDWIIYDSTVFQQHKNFYHFYDEKIADGFFNSLYERFLPSKDYKIHGYFEVINYQQNEIVNLENNRVWLKNVFKGRHFHPYIKGGNQEGNFKQNNSKWCCWQQLDL